MGYRRSRVGLVCKDCEDRHPGCHDHCEKYARSKEKEQKETQVIKENAKVENLWIKYKADYFDKKR